MNKKQVAKLNRQFKAAADQFDKALAQALEAMGEFADAVEDSHEG